jgi:2-dehydropantoate 2-reductase
MIDPNTVIVPLQNGVESPTHLAEVLGHECVLGGLCKIFSALLEPGHIRHSGAEPTVIFGEMDNTRTERVQKLSDIFTEAGVTTEIPANIHVAMWKKFLFVSALGGVGAVTRVPFGPLREIPETRKMLEQAMEEIFAVAQGYAIPLPQTIVTDTMASVDTLPSDATTSMQRDIMEGRPSELDAQPGAVVRLGQHVGVATPLHNFIYHSLLPLELRARKKL